MRFSLLATWCLLLGLLLGTGPSAAQAPANPLTGTNDATDTAAEAPAEPAPPPLPGAQDVIPRYLELGEDAKAAVDRLEELADAEEIEAELTAAAAELETLRRRAAELGDDPWQQPQAIQQLGDRAELHQETLQGLSDRLGDRLEEAGEIRRRWSERADFWRRWREELTARDETAGLGGELRGAAQRIAAVTGAGEQAFETLLDLQRRLEELQAGTRALVDDAEGALATGRSRLTQTTGPALFSAAFGEQWRAAHVADDGAGGDSLTTLGEAADQAFDRLGDRWWVLLLQLALALAAGLVARRLAHHEPAGDRWSGILEHPWSIGVFLAVSTLSYLYEPAPAGLELLQVSLLAVSGAFLASDMFRTPGKRWAVYALALFLPVYLLLTLLALPVPWVRVLVAAATLVGGAGALAAGLRLWPRLDKHGFPLLLILVGTGLLVGFGAEAAGYDLLARWLLQSIAATAFVAFVVTFLLRLGRGAIEALIRRGAAGERFRFLKRVGHYLATRLTWLLRVVVLLLATFYVLDLWGVVDEPARAMRSFLSWGVPTDEPVVTLGQVLLAAFTLLVAFVLSRLLHAILEGELMERHQVDPGVGASIRTLVHYAVLTAGFLFALISLGVSLQSFAIVAGALGVGIGFGLQNVVGNFVSGLILLFERPVRVGDTLVVGDHLGKVKKIGLRSTVVITFDQTEVIVPNTDLVSEKVTNWTLTDRTNRILIELGVAYGSDVEAVFREIEAAVTEHPLVLEAPQPAIHFARFGDSALQFEIRVWVSEVEQRLDVRSDLLRDIDRRFRAAEITIPFPQRDLHVRTLPPGTVPAAEPIPPNSGEPSRS